MGLNTIAAGQGARCVLVVGVEKMTEVTGAEVSDILLARLLPQGGGRDRGRLCRHLRPDRAEIFPALRRPVRRARPHRRQEPQERRRQPARPDAAGSRLRVLPHRLRQEPARRRAAEAHRLLAGLGRRGGGGAGRYRRPRSRMKKAVVVPRRRAGQRFPADEPSATSSPSRGRRWPGSARSPRARLGLDDLDLVETHDCFTIAELIEYEAMGLTRQGRGRARHPRRLDRKGRQAADQSLGRPQIQGPSGRRDRRLDACAGGDAADRHGRRHADPGRHARRRLQHGRRRGRQLRQHPRAAARPDAMAEFQALVLHEEDGKVAPRIETVDEAQLPRGRRHRRGRVLDPQLQGRHGPARASGGWCGTIRMCPGIDFAGTVERSNPPGSSSRATRWC